MDRFRRPQPLIGRRTIGPPILATSLAILPDLLGMAGCSRPAGPPGDDTVVHLDQHRVPFHDRQETAPAPQDSSVARETAPNPGSSPASGLPFRPPEGSDSQHLPAGTLLTVRLKSPISAENPGSNGTFEAVVDEPVVVEGDKVVPRGATAIGRVESARVSNVKRNRGYVRLALDSIYLDGAALPIRTSSLFVRGSAVDAHMAPGQVAPVPQNQALRSETPSGEPFPGTIRVEKGRRLTFRLTGSAYVAASQRTAIER